MKLSPLLRGSQLQINFGATRSVAIEIGRAALAAVISTPRRPAKRHFFGEYRPRIKTCNLVQICKEC